MKKLTTILILFLFLNQAQAQLAGTYTVDATKATKKTNFNSIEEALAALTFQGLDGDVILEIAPGTYNQPLVIEGVDSDLGYGVHILNRSTEKVQFVNDGLSILVSNSKNVTITDIYFEAISTEMSSMVIISNSNKVVLESNKFIVKEINSKHLSVVSISNTSHENIVRMNTIKGASGFEVSRLSNNNTIASNDVAFANTGIAVLSSIGTKIECNLFKGILSNYKKGILVDGFVGDITITSNAILSVNEGISQIITYRPSEQKMSGNIINNLIESKGNTINLNNNVQDLQIAFNSFTSRTASVIYFTEEIKQSVSKITLFANNLLNWTESPILDIANPNLIGKSDYNNIYNENGSFYTKVGAIECRNLAEWKSNTDAKNSISVDPMFVAFGKESYKLAENTPCINAGPSAYDIGTISILEIEDTDMAKINKRIGAGQYDQATFDKIVNEFELAFKK